MNDNHQAWEQAITKAITELAIKPQGEMSESEFFVSYDADIFPLDEVYARAEEILKASNLHTEIKREDGKPIKEFVIQFGFGVGNQELTKPGAYQFRAFLHQLQTRIDQKHQIRKFILNKKVQSSYYTWISDPEGIIGGIDVHYEVIRRKSNGRLVYLEIHFEGEKLPLDVDTLIKLDNSSIIRKINHDGAAAIQFTQSYDIYSPDTPQDILNALNEIDELVGRQLRKTMVENNSDPNHEIELNQIFYGPPGTGKTFITIDESLKIVDYSGYKKIIDSGKSFDLIRKDLTDLFRNLLIKDWDNPGEGKIVFTTFHQSLSYEDFIEGIKPKKDEGEKDVYYEIEDGIFKKLCVLAERKLSATNFEQAYAKFTEDVLEKGSLELETISRKVKFDIEINGNHTAVAIPKSKKSRMSVTKEMIRDYLQTGEIRDWDSYVTAIGKYILDKYDLKVEEVDNTQNSFVIIMDEINRGNVSSIFGELITLIEPSKRKGAREELEVTLPYSKRPFSVPNNVHLIGTMNTADRSVEALDTALRRRFSFVEKNPTPDLLSKNIAGLDLSLIVEKINARLTRLIDNDHQIGHAYFIGIQNKSQLILCFKNKILPLLAEYFYGEIGKIGLVLGESFLEKEHDAVGFAKFDYYSESERADFTSKISYKISRPEFWIFEEI